MKQYFLHKKTTVFFFADFGNDQFSSRISDEGENKIIKPLDYFSFEAFKFLQNQNKQLFRKKY